MPVRRVHRLIHPSDSLSEDFTFITQKLKALCEKNKSKKTPMMLVFENTGCLCALKKKRVTIGMTRLFSGSFVSHHLHYNPQVSFF